jgi:drug/metabolite transporter (DMT)-like permease
MSPLELGLCVASVFSGSASQLFMKAAARPGQPLRRLAHLGAAGCLQLVSFGLVVVALRTLPISQLIPFAGGAYLLVPLGGSYLFGERLHARFWAGALLLVAGIVLTQL